MNALPPDWFQLLGTSIHHSKGVNLSICNQRNGRVGKCPSHVSSLTACLSEPAETSWAPLTLLLFPGIGTQSLTKILGNAIPDISAIFYSLSIISFILTDCSGQRISNKTLCQNNEGLVLLQV